MEPKTYQCIFRIGTSHFLLDLQAPLASFWSDVVVCFEPAPQQFTGLYAGLQYGGRDIGELKGLQGKSKFLLCASADETGLTMLFQVYLRDMKVRKVALTEPVQLANSQVFASLLIQTSLDFLNYAKYSELVFTTSNKDLYEQLFNVLTAQGKSTFEEGNGIANDEVLLRVLVRQLRCKSCSRLSNSSKVTQCCRRLLCGSCAKEGRPCCGVPPSLLPAPCSNKLLSPVQLHCNCGTSIIWKDSERHALRCSASGAMCPICQTSFSNADYLQHLVTAHPNELLGSYASVSSPKDTLLYQQSYPQPPAASQSATWSCQSCSNLNSASQVTCLRCNASRRCRHNMERALSRLATISCHLTGKSTLTVTDNRTGKTLEFPVTNNFIKANDLAKFKDADGEVLRAYDPGYLNTICCTSSISYIDGDKGILEYRGIPIEVLAEKSSFLEVSYLLIYGDLPTQPQFERWEKKIMAHTYLHTDIANMIHSFHYDAHPMGIVVSTVSAMSTFQPD